MAVVSGVVKDKFGVLTNRVVRVHRKSDGAVAFTTVSDSTTGAFSGTSLDSSPHYALVFDATEDAYWKYVVLAMRMDDTGLTDLKGHTVTKNGNAARVVDAAAMGGYAAEFDGAGDYLTLPDSVDWNLVAGDFFFRTAVTLNAAWAAQGAIITQRADNALFAPLWLGITSDRKLRAVVASSTSTSVFDVTGTTVIPTGTRTAIGFGRSGSTFKTYINGAVESTQTSSATLFDSSAVLVLGGDTNTNYFKGRLDETLLDKGFARYTAAYTPRTTPFVEGISAGTENALIFDDLIPV